MFSLKFFECRLLLWVQAKGLGTLDVKEEKDNETEKEDLGAIHLINHWRYLPHFSHHLSEKPGETLPRQRHLQIWLSGKVAADWRKSIWKCEKQPFPLHFREWPWRELSASSVLFSSLWNTEITKLWLKMMFPLFSLQQRGFGRRLQAVQVHTDVA